MRIAVFDPFCGVSGNMILGAMIDSGLELEELEGMLGLLPLDGWSLHLSQVERNGLRGRLLEVTGVDGDRDRNLGEITELIESSGLPSRVRAGSLRAFNILARAEASVHGVAVDQVHFHETGAVDAIIDITGAFCGFHLLAVEKVYSSPVATGTGTVECAHGTLPVPAPATMEILRGIPTAPSGLENEITTPTGAAVLAASVDSWEMSPPSFVPVSIGYGAGSRILKKPNLLRLIIGDTGGKAQWERDQCVEIRTLLDDMDPRLWPDVARKVLESGAVDCYTASCIGRKGRPAQEVTIVCPHPALNDVTECIFRNTTTLGVRIRKLERAVLSRDMDDVETVFGTIRVKKAYLKGELLRAEPEYEDCAAAAESHGVPVRDVLHAARCAAGLNRGE